jgi:reactive intermediate/imine deaminase
MSSIERIASELPYPFSKAVLAGGFLFLAGQVALDAAGQPLRGDIASQTRAVLDNVVRILAGSGADLRNVVRVTVWLSDMALMADFNHVYREYFFNDLPARSTVSAKLAFDVDIEIEVTAFLPNEK